MPLKRANTMALSSFELKQKKIKDIIKKFGVKPGRSRFSLIGTGNIHWNVWFDGCLLPWNGNIHWNVCGKVNRTRASNNFL
jgi:uncharacterized protein YxjI